ncbi:hypothetical protein QT979_16190 [Microcoleus sp. w2-18bC1]|uniref:hypothetical protein n=1 Tax=unclassified Microcoleus TaxID=2642155 RepID=UPI002FD0BD25
MLTLEAGGPHLFYWVRNYKPRAVCQARPEFSGRFDQVGENGFGSRSVLGNGGSGAVWDALLWE